VRGIFFDGRAIIDMATAGMSALSIFHGLEYQYVTFCWAAWRKWRVEGNDAKAAGGRGGGSGGSGSTRLCAGQAQHGVTNSLYESRMFQVWFDIKSSKSIVAPVAAGAPLLRAMLRLFSWCILNNAGWLRRCFHHWCCSIAPQPLPASLERHCHLALSACFRNGAMMCR